MESYNDRLRIGAIRAYATINCPELINEILKYGSADYSFRTRFAVLDAVSKYSDTHPEVVNYLISNLNDSSKWIKLRTIYKLRNINKPEVIEALKKAEEKEQDKRIKKSLKFALKHLARKNK